ncbi:MAG: AMP-binding protein [Kiritimatiellaeota bacterium]|nr:AMP-binding protein [Kiritimatiellota bacterium]
MKEHLSHLFLTSAERHAQHVVLSYPTAGETIVDVTFSDLLGQVRNWAARLIREGIKSGDRVGIITPKAPTQFPAFYACWWVGAIAVPICEALADLEMGFIIRDAEPSLILVDSSVENKVRQNAGDIPLLSFADLPLPGVPADPSEYFDVDPDDVAALIYTSGSTGMPKGVMLTHRNFFINAKSALEMVPITPSDAIMSLLPYWHSFALVVEVIAALSNGCRLIIPRDKRDFRKNIKRYQPTIMLVVPRIADALRSGILKRIAESPPRVRALFERAVHNASRIFTAGPRLDGGVLRLLAHHSFYDPMVFRKVRQAFGGRLRFFISGGAPLDLEHQIFFKYIGAPMYQGYGLTEATPIISANIPDVHKLGSCGKMLSWLSPENGGDYTFLDENGNRGKDLHGELLVRGKCVMKGYWRHRDASAKTLSEGWLHTGDMGYVDSEGFLFLDGRQGNMLVLVGGEKVHPEHVEDAIKSSEIITEAMVIGDKCKSIYACVNVDDEAVAGLAEKELLQRVRREVAEKTRHLAPFQRPKDVLILPEFTVEDGLLTVTMKVRRHKIWEKFGEQIRGFLEAAGEEIAVRRKVEIASSKVMETLGRNGNDTD